jgi:lipid II:glycine glycyltransferase (peptidoglycan interpeptide bridge formation enzyme)
MWIRGTAQPGVTEAEIFSNANATKRNEISAAQRKGIQVSRLHPERDLAALREAATLVNETAVRRQFAQINLDQTLLTWIDWMHSGQMEAWVARDAQGAVIAMETALRHGERLTSHHAGSREAGSSVPAGAVVLLRWTLIDTARQEGRIADLGGVDVVGHREIPQPGEKMFGLYDYKRAFGAEWVAMSGAHRIILDPRRYALRLAIRTVLRAGR